MTEEEDKARMAELDRIVRASPGARGLPLFEGDRQGAQMNSGASGRVKMRFPVVTVLLLVANVVTFLVDMHFGMDGFKPDTDILVTLGANYAPMTLTGESWRLFSSMFMHASVLHIAVNMYMLIIIGMVAERSFGRLPYLAVYLASGVWGGLCSAWWSGHHTVTGLRMIGGMIMQSSWIDPVVSVGASGALMGIAGACVVARVIELVNVDPPAHVLEGTGRAIAQVIGINIAYGFFAAHIDQAAHLGGLMAGAAVGGLLFAFGRASFARGAVLSAVAAAVALAGAMSVAGHTGSDELRDMRAQVDKRMRKRAEALAEQRRREAIEKMAAEDLQRRPAPVSADVAAGTEIDLGGAFPDAMAVGPGGKRVYVAFGEDNVVKVVDLTRKALDRVIKGPHLPPDRSSGCRSNMCRGVGASGIAISGDGKFAYVTSMAPDALSIIDLATDKIVASIPVGRFPRRVMLSGDGKLAFVMNSVDNSYSVVDLAARRTIGPAVDLPGGGAQYTAFGRPLSAWMSGGGTDANFFDSVGNTVAVFDAKTRAARAIGPIGDVRPERVFPLNDHSLLLYASEGLASYDIQTRKTHVDFVRCSGASPSRVVALSPDKTMLAIAELPARVHLVKRNTGRTVGLYPVLDPNRLAFSADGRFIYALSGAGQLSIIDVDKSLDVKQRISENGDLFCLPER